MPGALLPEWSLDAPQTDTLTNHTLTHTRTQRHVLGDVTLAALSSLLESVVPRQTRTQAERCKHGDGRARRGPRRARRGPGREGSVRVEGRVSASWHCGSFQVTTPVRKITAAARRDVLPPSSGFFAAAPHEIRSICPKQRLLRDDVLLRPLIDVSSRSSI